MGLLRAALFLGVGFFREADLTDEHSNSEGQAHGSTDWFEENGNLDGDAQEISGMRGVGHTFLRQRSFYDERGFLVKAIN